MAAELIQLDASVEFNNVLMDADGKDERIDLVQQVRMCGEQVSRKNMVNVDIYAHALGGHDGIYTSKHLIYA